MTWTYFVQNCLEKTKSNSIKSHLEFEEPSRVVLTWVLISMMTFFRRHLLSFCHWMNSRIPDFEVTFCRRFHFPAVNDDFRSWPHQLLIQTRHLGHLQPGLGQTFLRHSLRCHASSFWLPEILDVEIAALVLSHVLQPPAVHRGSKNFSGKTKKFNISS